MALRTVIRHQALNLLSGYYRQTGRIESALKANRVQFLYLHHLFPEEEAPFGALLLALLENHRIIPYTEAVERILEGKIDGPFISISFDDGFKNTLSASKILRQFGISACFFICPEFVGEMNEERLRMIFKERFHRPPMEFLNWNDVETLLSDGHEIGSHTMTHRRLSDLTPNELDYEIRTSQDRLKSKVGTVRHFSWPYGRSSDITPEARRFVFESGFISCASAERGCHRRKEKSGDSLRRDHIVADWPISHIEYFLARNALND